MNLLRLYTGLLALILSPALRAQEVRLATVSELEQRFSQGRDTTYVVNFWATWCAPCVAELPNFEKLQQTYNSQPLKVLLVSLDFRSEYEKSVKPFVKKAGLKNEVFLLNESNQQEYIDRISKEWSGSIPATLVVNHDRKVRRFYEQEFTFDELNKVYQSFK